MNFLSYNTIYNAKHFYDIEESLKTNIDFCNIDEYYDFLHSMDMSGIRFKEDDLVYILELMKSEQSFDEESNIVFVKFSYFENKYHITSLFVTR